MIKKLSLFCLCFVFLLALSFYFNQTIYFLYEDIFLDGRFLGETQAQYNIEMHLYYILPIITIISALVTLLLTYSQVTRKLLIMIFALIGVVSLLAIISPNHFHQITGISRQITTQFDNIEEDQWYRFDVDNIAIGNKQHLYFIFYASHYLLSTPTHNFTHQEADNLFYTSADYGEQKLTFKAKLITDDNQEYAFYPQGGFGDPSFYIEDPQQLKNQKIKAIYIKTNANIDHLLLEWKSSF